MVPRPLAPVTPATSVPQGCKPKALPKKPLAAQTTCSVPRSLSLRGPPDPTEPVPPPAWHVTAVRTSHTLLCSAPRPRPRPPSSTSVLYLPLWEAWALGRAIGQGWPREGPFSQTVQTHPRRGWWASPTLGWARKVRTPAAPDKAACTASPPHAHSTPPSSAWRTVTPSAALQAGVRD